MPLAAYVDRQMLAGKTEGLPLRRHAAAGEAWKRALAALDEVAQRDQGRPFAQLTQGDQDAMLQRHGGRLASGGGAGRHAGQDLLDLARHPRRGRRLLRASRSLERDRLGRPRLARAAMSAWTWTGATRGSPRKPRRAEKTGPSGRTSVSADPSRRRAPPRAARPDVFRPGAWVPMRQFADAEEVDFVVIGTGAGGGPVIAGLAEQGYSVVGFDAGPYFRPLEDFASDESEQEKLYWNDDRISEGANPLVMGGKNSGKAVGGSTVHFAMVSLRFRPEWFKSRSQLGYGADWPLDWREMWDWYGARGAGAVDLRSDHLSVGPEAAALSVARASDQRGGAIAGARGGGDGLCLDGDAARHRIGAEGGQPALRLSRLLPLRLLDQRQAEPARHLHSARAGRRARRSATWPWSGGSRWAATGAPRACTIIARAAGAFRKRAAVVVAGYAIETPRLLLNSANDRFPDGLANSSGLVGRNLMSQSNQAAWGYMDEVVRAYKAPPSTTITEHWNYEDRKDFFGGYCWMAQGPLPIETMTILTGSKGLWGAALHEEMLRYNHLVGLKMVGEQLPNEDNRVTLADDTDQYGLRIPRITYSWGENDKAMIHHALDQMSTSLELVGAKDILRQENDMNHLAGTARMGFTPRTAW